MFSDGSLDLAFSQLVYAAPAPRRISLLACRYESPWLSRNPVRNKQWQDQGLAWEARVRQPAVGPLSLSLVQVDTAQLPADVKSSDAISVSWSQVWRCPSSRQRVLYWGAGKMIDRNLQCMTMILATVPTRNHIICSETILLHSPLTQLYFPECR
ncbi:hypothetical protein GSI_04101 [Ganoderma sinense ZZ0214-1]|uniref:Uncharacterized protein n=1 Tax=Ganoderma sinense ZZ0214-1 TaxID=1077348 RepID=A0A2G8SIU5_9APHY|nr:hypothetical protein GSI_04101 [Ganoderma sinense ZZ0214-1]